MEYNKKDASLLHMTMRAVARYGLSTKDTLLQLIELYMEHYERLGNEAFLHLANLYMRTYLESRFDCEEHAELFQRILTASGRGELELYLLTVNYFCRLVPLTKESIGNILGRWLSGSDRSGLSRRSLKISETKCSIGK